MVAIQSPPEAIVIESFLLFVLGEDHFIPGKGQIQTFWLVMNSLVT